MITDYFMIAMLVGLTIPYAFFLAYAASHGYFVAKFTYHQLLLKTLKHNSEEI